jgi:hypothetical protein
LSARGPRLEGIAEVLGLTGNLPVSELHDTHRVDGKPSYVRTNSVTQRSTAPSTRRTTKRYITGTVRFGSETGGSRSATATAGSPQIADITSTVGGKALGAEGRLVLRALALAVFPAPALAAKGCRIAPTCMRLFPAACRADISDRPRGRVSSNSILAAVHDSASGPTWPAVSRAQFSLLMGRRNVMHITS